MEGALRVIAIDFGVGDAGLVGFEEVVVGDVGDLLGHVQTHVADGEGVDVAFGAGGLGLLVVEVLDLFAAVVEVDGGHFGRLLFLLLCCL